ncbi:MAG: tRNA (N(6)-L-threonylcarbamoyladenosine(37)-C(2))-methylthiotransferase MtaB [Heliobacteriaceae bacterium]|nr:tRNA (N(6)-L-threonylcarbamoyladenosine(37)-C(2))-methylthiotransferase MtaB [Heliobacteriaceae bacterium]
MNRSIASVAIHTLGCKVNQGESAALAGLFTARGYRIVPFDVPADVYVINTCSVTHVSDRKSRQAIRRAKRLNPQAVVVVSGCYAQLAAAEVQAIPGVDIVVGTKGRSQVVDLVEKYRDAGKPINTVGDVRENGLFEEMPGTAEISRVRALLKIQDGCDRYCTYCVIPYARGPSRSRPPASVLREAERLVAAGFQEIVLTGIHVGVYGLDLQTDLAQLVTRLRDLPGLRRLRLGSVEPQEFSPALFTAIDHHKVCPHFHIPLQSGADRILAQMGRKYRRQDFREVVAKITARIPDAAVAADVIVGFPGETEHDFTLTVSLCQEMMLAGIHVFPFSPRRGTPAASFSGQVPSRVKAERVRRLGAVAGELANCYAAKFVGRTKEVLVEEGLGDGWWAGHTANYLKVIFRAVPTGKCLPDQEALRGRLLPVNLIGRHYGGHLTGTLANDDLGVN